MGLDALLASLDARAAEERAAVIAEAKAEVDRIRTDAERESDRRRDLHLSRVREAEERAASKTLVAARMEARSRILDARRRVADRVRDALARRIAHSAEDPRYLEVATDELDDAIGRAGGPDRIETEIRLSEELAARLGDWIERTTASGIPVTPDPEVRSGFVLTADEGRIAIDGTLESRLELAWRRLAAEALREAESSADDSSDSREVES